LKRRALLSVLCSVYCATALGAAEKPAVAGWIENTRLLPSGLEIEAKLDSGAENSSLHIEKERYFRRDGKRWVRFTVQGESGRRVAFERRVRRYASIKRHNGGSDTRAVVEIKICLGSVVKQVEVNLVDRSRFDYELLVGRSFLAGDFLIDTSTTHLHALDCGEEESK
jgi:hypothetical protein